MNMKFSSSAAGRAGGVCGLGAVCGAALSQETRGSHHGASRHQVMTNPMQRLTAEAIKCGLVPFLAKGRGRFRPFQNEAVQALARAEEDAEREPIKRKLHSPIEKALEPSEVIALVKNTSRKTTQKQTVPPQVTIDFGAHCLARECHASRKC
jgi:hypothetical protein